MKVFNILPLFLLISCAQTQQRPILTKAQLEKRFDIVKPSQELNGFTFNVSEFVEVPQLKIQNCRVGGKKRKWSDMLASNKYASKSYQHELVEHPEKNKIISLYGDDYLVFKVEVENKTNDLMTLKDAVPVLRTPDNLIVNALRKKDSVRLIAQEFSCPATDVKEKVEEMLKDRLSYLEQTIMPGSKKDIYLTFKIDEKVDKGLWELSIFNLPDGKTYKTKLVNK